MRASHLRLKLYLVERRRNSFHSGHRVLAKSNTSVVPAHQHRLDVGGARQHPQERGGEEDTRRLRKNSKAIAYLPLEGNDVSHLGHVREAPVDVELGGWRRDVVVRQVRG